LYKLEITKEFYVTISLVAGVFKNGKYTNPEDPYFEDFSEFEVNNSTKNPYKVISKFKELLLDYIHVHNPPYVFFKVVEKNRQRVYNKMLYKNLPKNYSMCYDDVQKIFYVFKN
jgi:hypothetical protein